MKILYILKHNPWGIGGGCYASRNYLELFSEVFKDSEIDVLICDEYLDEGKKDTLMNCKFIPVKPRKRFFKYLIPITKILHRHQVVAKKAIKNNNYDFCIFDHNSIAGSLVKMCNKKGIKTLVINHNCEIQYFKDNNKSIYNLLLLPAIKKNELLSYKNCDYNVFLTEEDSEIFKSLYGDSNSTNIIGGCFLGKNESIFEGNKELNPKRPKIVISGTMGNTQNLDGINYFLDELYCKLPSNVDIILTGKNPPNSLFEKIETYHNITIVPNPDDILKIVRECDIFLCTTRLGGGMKYRVMDGIKSCLPILTHKVSGRGYKEFERKGFLFTFRNDIEFIDGYNKIISLLDKNKNLRKEIREFCSTISFEEKIKMFSNLLKIK